MSQDYLFPKEETAAERWARFTPINTGDDYIESLRGRDVKVYLFGEQIEEPVDHPIIRPSINSLRMTYDLAIEDPELATAHSSLIDATVNRFLHIVESPHDLVMKNKMQRRMGQLQAPASNVVQGLTPLVYCTRLPTILIKSTAHLITSVTWTSLNRRRSTILFWVLA